MQQHHHHHIIRSINSLIINAIISSISPSSSCRHVWLINQDQPVQPPALLISMEACPIQPPVPDPLAVADGHQPGGQPADELGLAPVAQHSQCHGSQDVQGLPARVPGCAKGSQAPVTYNFKWQQPRFSHSPITATGEVPCWPVWKSQWAARRAHTESVSSE